MTILERVCSLKQSMATNMIVAFIVLNVIRQVMIRVQSTRDRLGR